MVKCSRVNLIVSNCFKLRVAYLESMASAESNGSMRREVMSEVSMSAQDIRKLEMAVDRSEGS